MSTTNTDYDWYWYTIQKGRRLWLGLVTEDGAAPSSALTIEMRVEKFPAEVEDEDSILDIPQQFELAFAKGIAAELMQMEPQADSKTINLYRKEYDNMRDDMIGRKFRETQTPCIQAPLDLRDDD